MSERILSKYNLEILALADASQEYSGDLVAKLASRILDLEAELAALKEMQKIHKRSWFYRNCRTQRKRGAKICQVCPFRKLIEQQEAE